MTSVRALQHTERGACLISTASEPTPLITDARVLVGANANDRRNVAAIARHDAGLANVSVCRVAEFAPDGGGPRALWAAVNLAWDEDWEDPITAPTIRLFGRVPSIDRNAASRAHALIAGILEVDPRDHWIPLVDVAGNHEVSLGIVAAVDNLGAGGQIHRGLATEFRLRGCTAALGVITGVGSYTTGTTKAWVEIQLRS